MTLDNLQMLGMGLDSGELFKDIVLPAKKSAWLTAYSLYVAKIVEAGSSRARGDNASGGSAASRFQPPTMATMDSKDLPKAAASSAPRPEEPQRPSPDSGGNARRRLEAKRVGRALCKFRLDSPHGIPADPTEGPRASA